MQRRSRSRWCRHGWIIATISCTTHLYPNLNKLQRVQNALARTVMMTRKRDHLTPVLAKLHWFPVTARIQFKIALLTFKTLTSHQPNYIDDLLQQQRSSRLRFSGHNLLEIPRMRTSFAQRSFTYSAPHTWNTLIRDITGNLNVTANTIKKKLKMFYYITGTSYAYFHVTSAPTISPFNRPTLLWRAKNCIILITRGSANRTARQLPKYYRETPNIWELP